MEISLIPLIYLACLSLLLTPITYFVIFQVFQFNKTLFILNKYERKNPLTIIKSEENYYIADLYMKNQMWHIALTKLENEIYQETSSTNMRIAECYNAIGFIFHKLDYHTLAKKYYMRSSEIEPTYVYALKNLKSLMKS